MSEFSASNFNCDDSNNNDKFKNDTKEDCKTISEQYCKTTSEEDTREFKEYQKRYEKEGIHFMYEENIIKSHPDINTNIIFSEHSEKLINFSIFQYNYEEKKICVDDENYKLCTGTEDCNQDDDYFFIAQKIYSDEKVIIVDGSIGYSYDPKDIKLIYDLVENKIYAASYYRLMHCESDGKLFFDKYKMTNGLVILNKTSSDGKTEELVKITNDECKLLETDLDSIPYYRFPRSKDGVSVPRAIYNIFKVFQDPNTTHPEIIIPSEFYTYSDVKFTKIL